MAIDDVQLVSPPPTDWVTQLTAIGATREDAIRRLHELMLRAARHQVATMPERHRLGRARCEEIVQAAADEATMNVLARLDIFEGRSRFTTWAYKFAILQVATEVRRSAWRDREVRLDPVGSFVADDDGPERRAEVAALSDAIRRGMRDVLTPHQRRVMVALVVDQVPIDVLAERLGTTRNTLYKTLHDARKRLREALVAQGLVTPVVPEEVKR